MKVKLQIYDEETVNMKDLAEFELPAATYTWKRTGLRVNDLSVFKDSAEIIVSILEE